MYPNVCSREPYEYVTLCSIAMYSPGDILEVWAVGFGPTRAPCVLIGYRTGTHLHSIVAPVAPCHVV